MYTDQSLICRDCGAEFVFTAGEQEFYARNGLDSVPQRCKPCRDKRKRHRNVVLYEIVCERCGEVVKVPFMPSPDRAAYCGDCYRILSGR
mgnify:CR=1 FL=1